MTRIYKEVEVTEVKRQYVGFVCDKCGKTIIGNRDEDTWEAQEAFHYRFTGGYGSVFGDMSTYEIDLCQRCLDETLGKYFRLIAED